jgi:hypothetical protein
MLNHLCRLRKEAMNNAKVPEITGYFRFSNWYPMPRRGERAGLMRWRDWFTSIGIRSLLIEHVGMVALYREGVEAKEEYR